MLRTLIVMAVLGLPAFKAGADPAAGNPVYPMSQFIADCKIAGGAPWFDKTVAICTTTATDSIVCKAGPDGVRDCRLADKGRTK